MIYVITTFTEMKKNEIDRWDFGSQRTVGYYTDLKTAQDVVSNNKADLWETIYDYALIEGIEEGLYQAFPYQELYKIKEPVLLKEGKEYANPDATYQQMEMPQDFIRYCLSMG